MKRALSTIMLLCAAASCSNAGEEQNSAFPKADRPVAPIVSSRWSDEDARDKANESDQIMDLAGIAPGMTVADIGAGEGYYTVRLANRVGKTGRVVAQDILPEVRDALALRVQREKLENVTVKLGTPGDPKLPTNFDRIMLVHMYHEVSVPYEFLWNLRPALKKGGRLIVVDADRPTTDHGTPPILLQCELAAVGYKMVQFSKADFAGGYIAAFEAVGERPEPAKIKPCAANKAQ
jgi:cyclopropane fatty-acyl-phospholipid synthase-like methyltransferase